MNFKYNPQMIILLLLLPLTLLAGPLTNWNYQLSNSYSRASAKSSNGASELTLTVYCELGKGLNIGIGPLDKKLNEDGTIFVDWQVDDQRSSGEIWYPLRGFGEYPNYTDDPVIFGRILAKSRKLVKFRIYNARKSNFKSSFSFSIENISNINKVVKDCERGVFKY